MADQTTPSSTGSEGPSCSIYNLFFKYTAPGDEYLSGLTAEQDKYEWLPVGGYGKIDEPFILPGPGKYTIKLGFNSVLWTELEDHHWTVIGQDRGKTYSASFTGQTKNTLNKIHVQCTETAWSNLKEHNLKHFDNPVSNPVSGIVLGSGCSLYQGIYEILVIMSYVGIRLSHDDPPFHVRYVKDPSPNLRFYVKVP